MATATTRAPAIDAAEITAAPIARLSLKPWLVALILEDALAATVAAALGLVIRFGETSTRLGAIPYPVIAALLPPAWLLAMALAGTYDRRRVAAGTDQFRRVVNASMWLIGLVAFTSYGLRAELSRTFVAVAFPAATALTLAGRYATRAALRRCALRDNAAIHRVVVVGTSYEAAHLIEHMHRNPRAGFRVVGSALTVASVAPGDDAARRLQIEPLVAEARRTGADTIAVAGAAAFAQGDLRRLSWELEGSGVTLLVVPDLTDVAGPRIVVRPVEGLPLLEIREPEFRGMRRILKMALDRIGSATLIMLLSPLLFAIALVIKLSDRGPVLFAQTRVGMDGREFRIWKFRTMRPDADAWFRRYLDEVGADRALLKLESDPRVTRCGRLLRRYSLDELPQLFNVLRGDMSLVGPRPHVADEVVRLGGDAHRRTLVMPGMTGLWQVSGRSDLTRDEAMRLDLYYIENWSIWLDLALLWRTVRAVIRPRGAY